MSQEKVQKLDEIFMDAETAKTQVGQASQGVAQLLADCANALKSQRGTELPTLLPKLKSFLESGITTMASIDNELKSIMADCAAIQNMFLKMGAK
jgi:hypothetical protein